MSQATSHPEWRSAAFGERRRGIKVPLRKWGVAALYLALVFSIPQMTLSSRALILEARQTGEALTGAFKAFGFAKPPGKPFDIPEYRATFEKATVTAREARLLVDKSMELESAPTFKERIADVEGFTQRRMDHISVRIAQLIVFFFAMLFLHRWVVASRFSPRSKSEGVPTASGEKKSPSATPLHPSSPV